MLMLFGYAGIIIGLSCLIGVGIAKLALRFGPPPLTRDKRGPLDRGRKP